MRFGFEVFEAVRREVGEEFVVGMRITADELVEEGLTEDDCTQIAKSYALTGLIDYVSVIGGHAADFKTYHDSFPSMHMPSAPYIKMAGAVKDKIDIPVLHATRITDAATAAYAVEQGFIDLVGMTRAFIADPHHVQNCVTVWRRRYDHVSARLIVSIGSFSGWTRCACTMSPPAAKSFSTTA